MSEGSQTIVHAAHAPSFNPVQTGLMQRKCVNDECPERKKRLSLQRFPTNHAETTTVSPIMHDFSRLHIGSLNKLTISKPDDTFEHEAANMADDIMRMSSKSQGIHTAPAGMLQRQTSAYKPPAVQTLIDKEFIELQTSATPKESATLQDIRSGYGTAGSDRFKLQEEFVNLLIKALGGIQPTPEDWKDIDKKKIEEGLSKLLEAGGGNEGGEALKEWFIAHGEGLIEKLKTEPVALVAGANILVSILVGYIAGAVSKGQKLPIESLNIPLNWLLPGLEINLKFKGPLNLKPAPDEPVEGSVGFTYTFGAGKEKKSGLPESDKIRDDVEREREINKRSGLDSPRKSDTEEKYKWEYLRGKMRMENRFGPGFKGFPAQQRKKGSMQLEMPSFPAKRDDRWFQLRMPGPRKREEESLQRKEVDDSQKVSYVPPIVHEVLQSPGQPLDSATRAFMEPRFGHDFSKVRVHTDAKAAKAARTVDALAYTVGRDVVFAAGRDAPHTDAGRHLLAHELTHVVQNRDIGTGGPIAMGTPSSATEIEADKIATAMQSPVLHNTGAVLQRQESKKPQTCSGWTCLDDLSKCDSPDPGKEGNGQPSTSWTLTVMIDVDVPTAAEVGITTFGHSYVKFNESNGAEYTYGFYPRSKAEVLLGGTRETPGCVVHPDLTHAPCIDYKEQYSLPKADYDKALNHAKLWCHGSPNYHLFRLNCTTFVAKVAEVAGKSLLQYRGKVSSAGITADNPNTLLESLRARDQARKPQEQLLAEWIVSLALSQQLRMAFEILNGMWMVVMLDTLTEVNKRGFLDHLIKFFPVAQGVNKPRLMTALRAVRLKAMIAKPTVQQIDEILAIALDLPDQQKTEIRAYLNR